MKTPLTRPLPPTSGGCGHFAGSGQPALGGRGGRMRPPPWPPEPDSNLAARPPVPGLLGPHVLAAPRGGPHAAPGPPGRPKCRRPRRPAAVRRPPGCRLSVCLAVSKAGGHGCRPPGCRPPGCRPPGCRPPGCRCIWPPFCKEGGPDIKRGPAGHDAGRLIKRRPRAGRRWRPTGLYPSSPH